VAWIATGLRSVGIEIKKNKRRDPSDACSAGKRDSRVRNFRIQVERETRRNFFLIRTNVSAPPDRLLCCTITQRSTRAPALFIVDSHDVVNQFSFWPRYYRICPSARPAPNSATKLYLRRRRHFITADESALYIQDAGAKEFRTIWQAVFPGCGVAGSKCAVSEDLFASWDFFTLCLRYLTLPR